MRVADSDSDLCPNTQSFTSWKTIISIKAELPWTRKLAGVLLNWHVWKNIFFFTFKNKSRAFWQISLQNAGHVRIPEQPAARLCIIPSRTGTVLTQLTHTNIARGQDTSMLHRKCDTAGCQQVHCCSVAIFVCDKLYCRYGQSLYCHLFYVPDMDSPCIVTSFMFQILTVSVLPFLSSLVILLLS